MTAAEKLSIIVSRDKRYDPAAYIFIYEALDWTIEYVVKRLIKSGHVTGMELLEGVRQLAIEQFGSLAKTVLHAWGVFTAQDIGEIVYNLIAHDLLGIQDGDKKTDFNNFICNFDEVFNIVPVFDYCFEHKIWHVKYMTRSQYRKTRKRAKKQRRMP